jgi:hypothetical protein
MSTPHPALVLTVAAAFSVFAITSCSPPHHVAKAARTPPPPLREKAEYHASRQSTLFAALQTVQEKGCIITVSDPSSGLLSAELNAPSAIPEEKMLLADVVQSDPSGKALAGIFFFFLIIPLIVMLAAGMHHKGEERRSDDDDDRDRDHHDHHYEHDRPDPPPLVVSYRYVYTLTFNSPSDSVTSMNLNVVRMVYHNGVIAESGKYVNPYLNHAFFEAMSEKLGGKLSQVEHGS